MHKTFKINQHATIKNSKNQVLLLKKDGKWMLPGGRIEDSDTDSERALLRELKEETGTDSYSIESIIEAGITPSGKTFHVLFEVRLNA